MRLNDIKKVHGPFPNWLFLFFFLCVVHTTHKSIIIFNVYLLFHICAQFVFYAIASNLIYLNSCWNPKDNVPIPYCIYYLIMFALSIFVIVEQMASIQFSSQVSSRTDSVSSGTRFDCSQVCLLSWSKATIRKRINFGRYFSMCLKVLKSLKSMEIKQ